MQICDLSFAKSDLSFGKIANMETLLNFPLFSLQQQAFWDTCHHYIHAVEISEKLSINFQTEFWSFGEKIGTEFLKMAN